MCFTASGLCTDSSAASVSVRSRSSADGPLNTARPASAASTPVHRSAGEQQLLGPLHAECAHQPLAPARAVDLAGAEMAVSDAGVVGDRDEVARERELQPAGDARTVDHRDAHESPVLHARVQRAELVEERAECGRIAVEVDVGA